MNNHAYSPTSPHLSFDQASDNLVDACLNIEEFEWVGTVALLIHRGMRSREDLVKAIAEVAPQNDILVNEALLDNVADRLIENQSRMP